MLLTLAIKALVFQCDLYQQTLQQLTRLQSLGNTENETGGGLEKGHIFKQSNVSVSLCVGGEEKELTSYASLSLTISFRLCSNTKRQEVKSYFMQMAS